MRSRRIAPLVLAAVLGLTGACGQGSGQDVADTIAGGPPAPEGTLVWWSGSSLHVGSRAVDVGPAKITQAVSTRGGVYVLVDDELRVLRGTRLHDTGQRVHGPLAVSPSGRHLAYLDATVGPRDEFDTRRLTTVLWDVQDHRLVASTGAGMGDVGDDDLTDLYEETEPSVLGFVDDELAVATTDDYLYVSLRTGKRRTEDGSPENRPPAATQDGIAAAVHHVGDRWRVDPLDGNLAVQSPTKRFTLVNTDGVTWAATDAEGRVIDVDGLPSALQPGAWTDDHTVAVITFDRDQEPAALEQCDLERKRCTRVAEGHELGREPQVGAQATGSI